MKIRFSWSAIAGHGIVVGLCLGLAACGGGDSSGSTSVATPQPSSSPATTVTTCEAPSLADGVFGATISPSGEVMIMITRTQDAWGGDVGPVVFIGNETGSAFVPTTVGRVRYTCQTGNQAPRNTWLYGEDALLTATIDPAAPSMSGEIASSTTTRTFAGGRIPDAAYDYRQAASLALAVGTLEAVGSAPGQGPALIVRIDGTVTLSGSDGATVSGRVYPTGVGKLRLSFPQSGVGAFAIEGVLLAYETARGGRRLFAYLFASDGWDWSESFWTGSAP